MEYVLTTNGLCKSYGHFKVLDEIQVGKMFDRFYTVESEQQSTGLGLSIARTLVEQMGGSIGAEYYENKLRIFVGFEEHFREDDG